MITQAQAKGQAYKEQAQQCCFKELVLAHHAYERAMQEFAKTAGLHTGHLQRMAIAEVCAEYDPREIDGQAVDAAIQYIKEA